MKQEWIAYFVMVFAAIMFIMFAWRLAGRGWFGSVMVAAVGFVVFGWGLQGGDWWLVLAGALIAVPAVAAVAAPPKPDGPGR